MPRQGQVPAGRRQADARRLCGIHPACRGRGRQRGRDPSAQKPVAAPDDRKPRPAAHRRGGGRAGGGPAAGGQAAVVCAGARDLRGDCRQQGGSAPRPQPDPAGIRREWGTAFGGLRPGRARTGRGEGTTVWGVHLPCRAERRRQVDAAKRDRAGAFPANRGTQPQDGARPPHYPAQRAFAAPGAGSHRGGYAGLQHFGMHGNGAGGIKGLLPGISPLCGGMPV